MPTQPPLLGNPIGRNQFFGQSWTDSKLLNGFPTAYDEQQEQEEWGGVGRELQISRI